MTMTLQELEQALKEDPRSRLFFQLAGEYRKMGKLEEARALLEKGLGFYPNHVDARLLLAQIYMAAANLDGAKSMVDRILLVVPDHVAGNHLAADIYYSMENQELALKHYRIVELFEPGRAGVAQRLQALTGDQAEEAVPAPVEEPEEAAQPSISPQAEEHEAAALPEETAPESFDRTQEEAVDEAAAAPMSEADAHPSIAQVFPLEPQETP